MPGVEVDDQLCYEARFRAQWVRIPSGRKRPGDYQGKNPKRGRKHEKHIAAELTTGSEVPFLKLRT